ncbi:MAG: hypothetical protein MJ081_02050 [Ruminococcus sp.]|nr:hypothetical protein [Ruminococcus sp.]
MRKVNRKIICGAIVTGCTLLTMTALSGISKSYGDDVIPVSLQEFTDEKPVIILDAGHGEET